MRMTYQPNRPVRVGTAMVMTDKNGNLHQEKAKQADKLPALSGLTKDELSARAEVEGVDITAASNNDERRIAIEAARMAAANPADGGSSDPSTDDTLV